MPCALPPSLLQAHHLATASYDGSIRLWDLRSTVPLATLTGHSDKALCVSWLAGSGSVVSGGADCTLRLYAQEPLPQ